MVDFGNIAKQAQDALKDGADKLETALKDNAGKIDGAVDKAAAFARDKFPDRATQIDQATGKAKGAVPRHGDDDDASTPGTPLSSVPTPVDTTSSASVTPEVDRTAAEAAGSGSATPAPGPGSPTPEVDRIARDQG